MLLSVAPDEAFINFTNIRFPLRDQGDRFDSMFKIRRKVHRTWHHCVDVVIDIFFVRKI